jgi:hypothetical protein
MTEATIAIDAASVDSSPSAASMNRVTVGPARARRPAEPPGHRDLDERSASDSAPAWMRPGWRRSPRPSPSPSDTSMGCRHHSLHEDRRFDCLTTRGLFTLRSGQRLTGSRMGQP